MSRAYSNLLQSPANFHQKIKKCKTRKATGFVSGIYGQTSSFNSSIVCHFTVFTSNISSFAPFFSAKVRTVISRMIKTPIEAVIMKGDGTGGKDEHCLIQIEM